MQKICFFCLYAYYRFIFHTLDILDIIGIPWLVTFVSWYHRTSLPSNPSMPHINYHTYLCFIRPCFTVHQCLSSCFQILTVMVLQIWVSVTVFKIVCMVLPHLHCKHPELLFSCCILFIYLFYSISLNKRSALASAFNIWQFGFFDLLHYSFLYSGVVV